MESSASTSLVVSLEHAPRVNFAFQQNSIPVLYRLELRNDGDLDLEDLRVRIRTVPEVAHPFERVISHLPVGGEAVLDDLDLQLSFEDSSQRSERIRGELILEVCSSTADTPLVRQQTPLDIYAWNEWTGLLTLPEILCAFVTPNLSAVQGILSETSTFLRDRTGDSKLDGYQSGSKERVFDMVGSLYDAVARRNIRYSTPPASFEMSGQKVRFAPDILERHFATCLDLSLMFAGLLEQMGLHPLLMLHEGHIYCGCWLKEETFGEPSLLDLQSLRKRVEFEDILVFECTACTDGVSRNLQAAIREADDHLHKAELFQMVIDVRRARASGILPLPLSETGDSVDEEQLTNCLATHATAKSSGRTFAPVLETVVDETPATRIDRWKQQLLDLTLRNRLLNFRETKQTVQFACHAVDDLKDAFSSGTTFRVEPANTMINGLDPRELSRQVSDEGESPLHTFLRDELAAKRVRAPLGESELGRRLLELYRSSRLELQESGSNTLFLAIGMLEWKQSSSSDRTHVAPLLLIPAELHRKSVVSGFTLTREDADPLINVTLLELLRKDFALEIPGIDPLPEDENGVDVRLVLRRIRQAVLDLEGWEVHDAVWLGRFSFNKFLLWKDLQDRVEHLTRNSVVDHLINRPGEQFDDGVETLRPDELDAHLLPRDVLTPLSADSSQLAAVAASAEGKNFVLYGPPGTGKSQTIANMIVHNIACGRSVLFVAEKRAALEVVHQRLSQLGLEAFCLELHSNKSGKADVLRQFGHAMDVAAQTPSRDWETVTDDLEKSRSKLNQVVAELHRPGRGDLSAFRCASYMIAHKKDRELVRDLGTLTFDRATMHSRTDLEEMNSLCQRLALQHRRIPSEAFLALKECHFTEWTPNWQQSGLQFLAELEAEASSLLKTYEPLLSSLGLQPPRDLHSTRDTILFCLRFSQSPVLPQQALTAPGWRGFANEVRQTLLPAIRAHQEAMQTLADFDIGQLRDLDVAARYRSWLALRQNPSLFNRLKEWWLLRPLKAAATNIPKSFDWERSLFVPFASLLEQETIVRSSTLSPEGRLGAFWQELQSNPDLVTETVGLIEEMHHFAETIAGRDAQALSATKASLGAVLEQADALLAPGAPLSHDIRKLVDHWNAFDQARTRCKAHFHLDESSIERATDIFDHTDRFVSDVRLYQDHLRNWSAWERSRQDARNRQLNALLDGIELGKIASDEAPAAFAYLYRMAVIGERLEQTGELRTFFGEEHEQDIRRFVELDDQYLRLAAETAKARLASELPRGRKSAAIQGTELGVLQRERTKKRRHKPVRTLLQEIPSILPKLKPCLMMSPLSVAQYLDAEHSHFDLVIFDEASQIPVWDAVGAIARGKQIVIAGDPKQLPPTNFFGRAEEEDTALDDGLVEDQESILDECMAAGIPCSHLNWHYRSQDESLIAFSNHHTYEDRLFTFPSADTTQSGVRWKHVPEGHYDKGRTRTNRAEGLAVVEQIVQRLQDPDRCSESIGVVTFSQAQQELIENLLDEARREHPSLEVFFDEEGCDDPVFVKNLENVQGDERDVILFSVGYGPDAGGKLSMNFGPLNRAGGERRLNVAVTRAKKEVLILSTLRPEHIDLSRTSARGVAQLKAYLEYAQRGPRALGTDVTQARVDQFDSLFEKEVNRFLEAKGFEVHTQIGCSNTRIDLAVVDPSEPGRYLVGIECDGSSYHRSATARDRDRLRQAVLENLGWHMVRVWSSDWWNGRQEAEERLLRQVRDAIELHEKKRTSQKAVVATEPPSPPKPDPAIGHEETVDQDSLPPRNPEYAVADLSPQEDQDLFYTTEGRKIIRRQLKEIVSTEGPIERGLVDQRIIEAWGFSRGGTKIRQTIADVLTQTVQTETEGTHVLWPKELDRENYTAVRIPNPAIPKSVRDIDQIPGIERRNAMRQLLQDYGSMPEDTLLRETLKLFGKRTLTGKMRTTLMSSLEALGHQVVRKNGTVKLA